MRSQASWQGAGKVLGVTALVWLGMTLLGLLVYRHGPPAIPVRVENRTGAAIQVRLLGRGCERAGPVPLPLPPGESEWLTAVQESPVGCQVLATDAESGAFVALLPVRGPRSNDPDVVIVRAKAPAAPRRSS